MSSRRASSASWAAIFSAQSSKSAKPLSRRCTCRYSSQKQRLVTRSRKARSWLTIRAAAREAASSSSSVSMARMSRWLVGSSSRRTSASSAKARASAARRISPPDSPWVGLGGVEAEVVQASPRPGRSCAPPAVA